MSTKSSKFLQQCFEQIGEMDKIKQNVSPSIVDTEACIELLHVPFAAFQQLITLPSVTP